jgi:DNA repair exonuclease SbcCD ATPase subunit
LLGDDARKIAEALQRAKLEANSIAECTHEFGIHIKACRAHKDICTALSLAESLPGRIEALESERNAAVIVYDEISTAFALNSHDRDRILADLDEARKKIEALEAERDDALEKFGIMRKEWGEAIRARAASAGIADDAQHDLDEARKKIEALEAERDKWEALAIERRHEIDRVAEHALYVESQLSAREADVARLREALRGGNALKDNADLLESLADRLVEVYHETPHIDYIRCARERAGWIRAALTAPVTDKEEG